ncbi:MAG: hypothetical protein J6Q96_01320 [Bacteroidales bacterium]|nr:hypothetical protein [Bacteroidales bacterium]
MKKYELNCELMNAVLPAVSKEEVRYYLMGIYIEDVDGWRNYTATDGHILLTAKEAIEGEVLEKPLVLKIKKPIASKRLKIGYLQIVDEYTAVIVGEEKIAVDIIDCQYPDYRRVIPSDDTELAKEYAIFNPDLLKIVNKFIGSTNKRPIMENRMSPAMWVVEDVNLVKKAVLMPMRYEIEEK